MKKAQISIVVLVLIILIVIILFFIVFNIINPLVKKNSEDAEAKAKSLSFDLEVSKALFFLNGATVIEIKQGASGSDLNELRFVFLDDSGESLIKTKTTILKELETKIYSFNLEGFEPTSVNVYPVVGEQIGISSEKEFNKEIQLPSSLVSWWNFNENFDSDKIIDFVFGKECLIDSNSLEFFSGFANCDAINFKGINIWVNNDLKILGENFNFNFNQNLVNLTNGLNNLEGNVESQDINHIFINFDDISMIYFNGNLVSAGDLGFNFGSGLNFSTINGIYSLMVFESSLSKEEINSIYTFQLEDFEN
jgi:hypothetical protein